MGFLLTHRAGLLLGDEDVPALLAALDLEELVELQDSPLTAKVALGRGEDAVPTDRVAEGNVPYCLRGK